MMDLEYMEGLEECNTINEIILNNDDARKDCNRYKLGHAFNVFHMNIRSLKKNLDNLIVFLESISFSFNIIVLSETWHVENLDLYQLKGYRMFYNESKINQNDGVMIYVEKTLNVSVKHDLITNDKISISKINFFLENNEYNIFALYRPNPTNENDFIVGLDDYLGRNANKYFNMLIGDINININELNETSNWYINMLSSHGFVSYINNFTRVEKNSEPSCIDHIFIKRNERLPASNLTSYIFETTITDHYSIFLSIGLEHSEPKPKFQTIIVKTVNYHRLDTLLRSERWEDVYSITDDVNLAYKLFKEKYTGYLKESTVEKSIKIRNKLKPWITNGLIQSIVKRDNLKKKCISEKNNVALWDQYKKYRNQLTKLLKRTKQNYLTKQVINSKNDTRKIWKIVKNSYDTEKQRITEIYDDKGIITDKKEIANIFVDYFSSIGEKMTNAIKSDPLADIVSNTHTGITYKSMFLKPVTPKEIIGKIDSLKTNTSPGIDNITAITIKSTKNMIVDVLVFIVNLCFEKGQFPQELKKAIVTPIFKNGSKQIPGNYRPISVISNFAKIIEKCIVSRLCEHLAHNKILSDKQFGFKTGCSTEDALIGFTSDVHKSLQKNKKVLAIFLDMAKAFDSLSHDILIKSLERYGIRGLVTDLFRNYLLDRESCVRIENILSDPRKIAYGVPQGTVLGPQLFLIYINGMLELPINGNIYSYADDTALLFHADSWGEVVQIAELGLYKVKCWLDSNFLSLNHEKTKFITFTGASRMQPAILELKLHSKCDLSHCNCSRHVQRVTNIKYLGIMIHNGLRWDMHTEHLTKKLRKLVYSFYKLREFLPLKMLKMVYRSLVESILAYGSILWGATYVSQLKPLMVTQNWILKVILSKNRRFPTEQLYKEFGVLSLHNLYVFNTAKYLYKHKELRNVIPHNLHTRSRSKGDLLQPYSSTTLYMKSVDVTGPRIYNMIPQNIKMINNYKLFSKKLFLFIMQNVPLFAAIL